MRLIISDSNPGRKHVKLRMTQDNPTLKANLSYFSWPLCIADRKNWPVQLCLELPEVVSDDEFPWVWGLKDLIRLANGKRIGAYWKSRDWEDHN